MNNNPTTFVIHSELVVFVTHTHRTSCNKNFKPLTINNAVEILDVLVVSQPTSFPWSGEMKDPGNDVVPDRQVRAQTIVSLFVENR